MKVIRRSRRFNICYGCSCNIASVYIPGGFMGIIMGMCPRNMRGF